MRNHPWALTKIAAAMVGCALLFPALSAGMEEECKSARVAGEKQKPALYQPQSVPEADVVVALGVKPDGPYRPCGGMISNLLTAVEILNAGKAKRLMVCGGYTWGHIAEAEMMAILAQAVGVPLGRILVEDGSVDTEENALNARLLAEKNGLSSAILVAQAGHIERATELFQKAGAFRQLYPVVGMQLVPEFPVASLSTQVTEDQRDAIVVHGVSPGFDFSADPLVVDARLVAMLSAASGLYRQGVAPRVIVWHPISPRGHIRRTEVMAILLSAMGVPDNAIIRCSSRRYEVATQTITKVCRDSGVKRVVALVPPDELLHEVRTKGRVNPRHLGGPASAAQATRMYQKAGIDALVVNVK